jgi:hypothetical protein
VKIKATMLASMVGIVVLLVGCASTDTGTPQGTTEAQAPAEAPADDSPSAPPAEDESSEEPLVNRLKWSTATEVDNFGFDVYRSTSEEGPFERITKRPMPGGGTVDEPQYYEFEDAEIDPTQDYYYYVESIAIDGTREVFSPIIKAKAKRPEQKK